MNYAAAEIYEKPWGCCLWQIPQISAVQWPTKLLCVVKGPWLEKHVINTFVYFHLEQHTICSVASGKMTTWEPWYLIKTLHGAESRNSKGRHVTKVETGLCFPYSALVRLLIFWPAVSVSLHPKGDGWGTSGLCAGQKKHFSPKKLVKPLMYLHILSREVTMILSKLSEL